MPTLTLRNVNQDLKTAIKEAAQELGVSQNEAALRALAKGLGKPIRKRHLSGLVEEIFGKDAPMELSK